MCDGQHASAEAWVTATLLQQGSAEATQQHPGCAPTAAEFYCCHQPHGCWSCGCPGQLRLLLLVVLAVNRASEEQAGSSGCTDQAIARLSSMPMPWSCNCLA